MLEILKGLLKYNILHFMGSSEAAHNVSEDP